MRLAPGDDAATVTAQQVRQVVTRLIETGHWRPGDAEILLVADAGYDAAAEKRGVRDTLRPPDEREGRRTSPNQELIAQVRFSIWQVAGDLGNRLSVRLAK